MILFYQALQKPIFLWLFLILSPLLTQSGHAIANPNILWIVVEDMSPDLGCYGCSDVRTPHLDKLAREGMFFTQVHVTAPACSPSRTALATGVFQTTLGAHHMRYSESLKPRLAKPIQTFLRQRYR